MSYLKSFFLILLLFSFGFSSQAETYSLVSEVYPPYEYLEGNRPVGLDIEILDAVSRKVGIQFKIIFVPWARALQMVKLGTADGIFSLMKNDERERFLYFPAFTLYVADSSIFVKSNFQDKIEKISDLKGKRVGVVYGNSYGKEFDQASYIIREPVVDHETLMKKLIGKREEMIITTKEVGYYYAKKYGEKGIRHLPLVIFRDQFYIGISKKSVKGKRLLNKISEGLRLLHQSGEIEKIKQKYSGI